LAATTCDDLQHPAIAWTSDGTYIQQRAINGDLGVYDSRDAFYIGHPSNVSGLRSGRFPDTPEEHVTVCPQNDRGNRHGS
jgi:hypothetical protein